MFVTVGFAQIDVSGDITSDVTWTATNTYRLTGQVFVKDGVTLTIEAGTNIYGKYGIYDANNTAPALVIERGAKIMAEGTIDAPITFRSELLETDPNYGNGRGLWGGLILNGKAPISTTGGENFVEGIAGVLYGGTDPDDNSGVLRYVRVYNGGSVIGADNEINGITLAGVGRGTTVEYCEVGLNADDGFEMFGGTVDLKYCSVVQVKDDAFDTDEGYQGRGQFLFVQKAADSDRAHEMDNKTNGDLDSQPRSHPRFANVTIIGGDASSDILKLREGTGGDFRNYIIVGGAGDGIENDDNGSEVVTQNWTTAQAAGYPDYLYLSPHILMWNVADPFQDNTVESFVFDSLDPGLSYTMGSDGFVVSVDPRPTAGGPAYSDVDSVIADDFFVQTNYRGAFASNHNWLAGWSWLDENNVLLDVDDPSQSASVPGDFRIVSSYPNPFNPSTRIQVNLGSAHELTFSVYALNGALVYTEQFHHLNGSRHEFRWSGIDQNGSALPSGIYLYQVKTPNQIADGKLTLLK